MLKYPLKSYSVCSEQGEWARDSEDKEALNLSRFAQNKEENLCSEDIFPLDLLRANFEVRQAITD